MRFSVPIPKNWLPAASNSTLVCPASCTTTHMTIRRSSRILWFVNADSTSWFVSSQRVGLSDHGTARSYTSGVSSTQRRRSMSYPSYTGCARPTPRSTGPVGYSMDEQREPAQSAKRRGSRFQQARRSAQNGTIRRSGQTSKWAGISTPLAVKDNPRNRPSSQAAAG